RRHEGRSGNPGKSLRHWSLGFAASYKRNKAAAIQVSTFRLTRVTRIFQKSVFTETTPAARAGCRAGFLLRARKPRPRMPAGALCRPPVGETSDHCFATVLYNENTYHNVWRRHAVIVRNPVSCRPRDLRPVIMGPCLRRDDGS